MIRLVVALVTALLIVVDVDGSRLRRASTGSYIGVVNGQSYGGHYHTPDNGPTVHNRFGDHPPSASGPGNGGSYAGSFAGGSSSGGSNYAPQFPFVNLPPFAQPMDFNSFFQTYFSALNDNLASAFSKNFAYQQAAFDAAQNAFQSAAANRFGPGPGGNGGNFHGAAASASFGPGGGHQSAATYPENPANPNIHNRFGGSGPSHGGSFGVSSASISTSSNGKTHKEAVTTVNNNGKVTTYRVKN